MRFILVFFLLTVVNYSFSQKIFTGKLVYSIEIADTNMRSLFPASKMVIYTNDTLLRVETKTELLGEQVMIHHLQKNKAYLLIATPKGKFAVQIPENEASSTEKYSFKKGKGKQVVAGLKSKIVVVKAHNYQQQLTFAYYPKISSKFLPGFESFPGLLTDYYTFTKDGLYHHQLIQIDQQPVSRDLFGIPSDYTKISMSDFVEKIMIGNNE
jgi:hypothetical protein